MTADDKLGPCDCFTLLERRQTPTLQCEVCDHIQAEHVADAGTRVLTGGEIEELRKRILIERYERRQQEGPRKPDLTGEIRSDGDPEVH